MKAYQTLLAAQATPIHTARFTHRPEYLSVEDQLRNLFATLPPAQRQRPFSLVELQARLTGRYRDRPSPSKIGEALRRLNFRSVRDWSAAGRGARVWIASGDEK